MISNKEYADYMRTKSEADCGVIRVSTEVWKILADIIGNSVEVVRCKDCVFWDISQKGFGRECACKLHSIDKLFIKYKVPNDFCSEGERRCDE
jgi:hypothetical protein